MNCILILSVASVCVISVLFFELFGFIGIFYPWIIVASLGYLLAGKVKY